MDETHETVEEWMWRWAQETLSEKTIEKRLKFPVAQLVLAGALVGYFLGLTWVVPVGMHRILRWMTAKESFAAFFSIGVLVCFALYISSRLKISNLIDDVRRAATTIGEIRTRHPDW